MDMIYNPPIKTIDNLEIGDVLVHSDENYEMKIVAVVENKVYKKYITEDSDDKAFSSWYVSELDEDGWHLKPNYLIVTKQQVADKFNVAVEQLKIVEEDE